MNIYHLETPFIVVINHFYSFDFIPFFIPEKIIQQRINFFNCTLMRWERG